MIIVSQDKQTIVNWENIIWLSIEGREIRCYSEMSNICIGIYKDKYRTQEVFDYILSRINEGYSVKLPEV